MRAISGRWMACLAGVICGASVAAEMAAGGPGDPSELPKLNLRAYKVAPFIEAAAALQSLGKEKACELLKAQGTKLETANGVMVLARMLFLKKPGGEFRRPKIGSPTFAGGTDYNGWPLEPIELVDGVPFLITRGYVLGGAPEPAEAYVRYCLANCDWNDFEFKKPSEKELQAALEKLLASPKWKEPLDERSRKFFAAQIKSG
jgi:hypothetical protein